MSNKIQSYINSSSPGRNRLPVPKKSFKSVLSQDRSILVPSKVPSHEEHDGHRTALLTSELKLSSAFKQAAIGDTSANNTIASVNVGNGGGSISSSVSSSVNSSVNSAKSEASASRELSRNNSFGSVVEGEDGVKESRKEAREAFLKSDHLAKKFEASRDLPEPPQPPHHAEKEANKYNSNHHTSGTTFHSSSNNFTTATATNHPGMTNGSSSNSHNGVSKGLRGGREQEAYIGFANLPNQVYRKSVKKGFDFTLMLIGESGLGKSTLINSMFLTDIYNQQFPGPSRRPSKTVKVEKMHVLLREGGVQLRLTIVDTPGFGDSVDNSECWKPILKYIDDQYDSYLNMESRVVRQEAADTRVHCCLYFISPNGHGLRQLDIECMKQLHEKVNIIPLIAKADTMTMEECRDFKKTITNEIEQHKIKIYEFPECEDEDEQKIMKKMKDKIPFAVVGSNAVVEVNDRKVRARVYPWGTVEVENLEHNDFTALRNMLIRTHLHDLKDVTNNVHYENFRFDRLLTSMGTDNNTQPNKSPMLQIEEEKKEHLEKMRRMEMEMGQMFEAKVNERRNKLHESDVELQRRKEQLLKSLEQQQGEYEEMRRNFLVEKDAWEDQNRHLEVEVNNTLKKKKTLFN